MHCFFWVRVSTTKLCVESNLYDATSFPTKIAKARHKEETLTTQHRDAPRFENILFRK